MMSFSSFVDVLIQRYSDYQFEDCPYEVFVVGGLSPGQSGNHLILPPALSLNRCQVKNAGSEKKIRELCRSVEELDLASNCIIDINEVYKIARSMPNLRFINLSENDLSKCNNIENLENHRIENIKSLVLNNTRIPWFALHTLLDSMPCIDDLHLSLNNYSSVELNSQQMYPNIRHLYISGNPELRNWEDIKKLMRTFPCLEGLTMADCNISTIPEDAMSYLPNLQSLNITNWPIKSWDCLERLNQMPKLLKLRCQGLDILNQIDCSEVRRHHLIARLPNIQRLNGSDISEDERVFAEKAFLRWYVINEAEEKPQRFYALQSIHGRVDPLAEVDFSPPKHADVKVVYNQSNKEVTNDENGEKHTKLLKIDLNKSVKDFKVQLSSMFGVSPSQMRVYYVDHEMSEILGPEELRFNQKKLYTYNVQDGDEFLIDHK
jgi:hypothetical protein